jgi:hypothetical protein
MYAYRTITDVAVVIALEAIQTISFPLPCSLIRKNSLKTKNPDDCSPGFTFEIVNYLTIKF